jgi:hydrogenase maturation protease
VTKIVILGIGNPYVSDDGVGPCVVREIEKRIKDPLMSFVELPTCSIDTLEYLRGFQEALIIDAAKTGHVPAGSLYRVHLHKAPSDSCNLSMHTLGLQSALDLGSALGLPLPHVIDIFAIEAADTETFHEGCTPEVEAAIPDIVERIIDFLKSKIPNLHCPQENLKVMVAS